MLSDECSPESCFYRGKRDGTWAPTDLIGLLDKVVEVVVMAKLKGDIGIYNIIPYVMRHI